MVVLLYFYILIVVRVKYLGEDVKNYMNNGLFCLKIWKINIKIIEYYCVLEDCVNMERFIGIIIFFMWKIGIFIIYD